MVKDNHWITLTVQSLKEELLSACLAGGGYYLIRQWLMDDIPKTPQEIADIVFTFMNKQYLV